MSLCRSLLAAVLFSSAAAAQNAEVNVTDLYIGYGFGPGAAMTFKVGYHLPANVAFEVKNGAFRGEIEITAPDSDGNDVVHAIPNIFVPEGVNRVATNAYGMVKIGKDTGALQVRMIAVDESGRRTTKATRTFRLDRSDRQFDVIPTTDQLVASIGEVGGVYEMKDLLKESVRMQAGNPPRAVRFRSERDMPLQWLGYTGLDYVVLATSDEKMLDRLDPQRASALRTWVRQGGRLAVCAAKNWQIVSKSFLAPMLPAELTGVEEIEFSKTPINSALESFAGGKARLETNKKPKFNLATLGKLRTPGKAVVQHAGRPLAYSGAYGLGQVTLVAFDPNETPFVNWEDAKLFWAKLMKLHIPAEDRASRGFYNSYLDDSRALNDRMEDFPDVTVVPFHWVALLIFGYILLIGPIDYFFLKKVVKRLELTWITFPTWVLLISVGAYYSAYFLKGDVLRANRLEIVDVDAATNTLRGNAYLCVFSPRIHSYDLSYTPGLAADGAWSQLAASRSGVEAGGMGEDQIVGQTSWHGIPEDSFRGMGDGGSGILGRREYGLRSHLGGTVAGVRQAPIQVWSTKTFTGAWLGKAKPIVEAKMTIDGVRLRGTIENLLDTPLENVVLAYDQNAWRIARLPPNLEVDLATVNVQQLTDFVRAQGNEQPNYYRGQYQAQTGRFADSEPLLRSLLFYRARGEVGSGRNHATAYLGHLDLTHQLEVGRVVMFAKVGGDPSPAGGKLWFEENPTAGGDPKPIDGSVKTQTYLRVVFDPLKETP
jgi:hypothetical protein